MLAFLPWLNIKAPIVQGPFHLFPQGVGDVPPDGVSSSMSTETMGKLLSQYRESANIPLRVVMVLQYDGRPLGEDFDEVSRTAIFRFGRHLAVSGLSDRRFIGGFMDGYTAAGHYQVVIQAFTEPFSGSISLNHRRKDGHSSVMLGQSDVHFVRPAHLVTQGEPNINLRLLAALQSVQTLPQAVHEHVDASVSQYLLANSDSPDVPLEAESIATYAALERVSGSDQSLQDIRKKLPALLAKVDGSPWTASLRAELSLPSDGEMAVLYAWLQQIYALRGAVAHGKPAHWAPQQWSQHEHLVAGAFIYPLVLKCLLAQHKLYALNEEDVAWTLGLEGLLRDRPFSEVPQKHQVSEDLLGHHDALSVPDSARAHLTRWQLRFDDINYALLGMALSQTITKVLGKESNCD
nr:hypothetical protein [uncultured Rhodoferax sp.]